MIEIDDKIVSADLLRECFACDLSQCRGICCVEGNAGAPLEAEELGELEAEYEHYKPCMTSEGIEAVEAWREGRTPFRKPVSCHLYPIRLVKFSNGAVGLNYHRWEVCASARTCGRRLGLPVYKSLREPIVRRFGEEFYKALEAAEAYLKSQN